MLDFESIHFMFNYCYDPDPVEYLAECRAFIHQLAIHKGTALLFAIELIIFG